LCIQFELLNSFCALDNTLAAFCVFCLFKCVLLLCGVKLHLETDDLLLVVLVLIRSITVQFVCLTQTLRQPVAFRRHLCIFVFCALQVFLKLTVLGCQLSQLLVEGFVFREQFIFFCGRGLLEPCVLGQVLLLEVGKFRVVLQSQVLVVVLHLLLHCLHCRFVRLSLRVKRTPKLLLLEGRPLQVKLKLVQLTQQLTKHAVEHCVFAREELACLVGGCPGKFEFQVAQVGELRRLEH
jgi:hypothetical protein